MFNNIEKSPTVFIEFITCRRTNRTAILGTECELCRQLAVLKVPEFSRLAYHCEVFCQHIVVSNSFIIINYLDFQRMVAIAQVYQDIVNCNFRKNLGTCYGFAFLNHYVVNADINFGIHLADTAIANIEFYILAAALTHEVGNILQIRQSQIACLRFNLVERDIVYENQVLVLLAECVESKVNCLCLVKMDYID